MLCGCRVPDFIELVPNPPNPIINDGLSLKQMHLQEIVQEMGFGLMLSNV